MGWPSAGGHCQGPFLFYGLMRARGWQSDCTLYWYSGEIMLGAEIEHPAKALSVKLEGGCTSNDAECVRMLTETSVGDSVGESAQSFFRRLGAKFRAEEAYVLEVCERLERGDSLSGSLISE